MIKLVLGRPHISPMLHNKSQSHQPLVLEKKILKGFYHTMYMDVVIILVV